jgi:hypothetical protein
VVHTRLGEVAELMPPRYGRPHRTRRQAWAPTVAEGDTICARYATGECVMPDPFILPGQAWQLDHIDGTTEPAHAKCNMSAGAADGNAERQPPWLT